MPGSPAPGPTAGEMFTRAARLRCPRCGARGLFGRWFRLRPECGSCGLDLRREPGYWSGAVMVNLAVTEGAFLVVFLALVLATAPDVPWGVVLAVVVAINVAVPVLFLPFSRTLWLAGDLAFRSATEDGA